VVAGLAKGEDDLKMRESMKIIQQSIEKFLGALVRI
jgi:hypothetical protein